VIQTSRFKSLKTFPWRADYSPFSIESNAFFSQQPSFFVIVQTFLSFSFPAAVKPPQSASTGKNLVARNHWSERIVS
jgi:hypothetical protein